MIDRTQHAPSLLVSAVTVLRDHYAAMKTTLDAELTTLSLPALEAFTIKPGTSQRPKQAGAWVQVRTDLLRENIGTGVGPHRSTFELRAMCGVRHQTARTTPGPDTMLEDAGWVVAQSLARAVEQVLLAELVAEPGIYETRTTRFQTRDKRRPSASVFEVEVRMEVKMNTHNAYAS